MLTFSSCGTHICCIASNHSRPGLCARTALETGLPQQRGDQDGGQLLIAI
jgi:hypothetical protein